MFSGDKRKGWKSVNDITQNAVKSLKSDHQAAVKSNEKPLIKHPVPISPDEQMSILLDSADDGAKMIVP